jgi:hypothetical protein
MSRSYTSFPPCTSIGVLWDCFCLPVFTLQTSRIFHSILHSGRSSSWIYCLLIFCLVASSVTWINSAKCISVAQAWRIPYHVLVSLCSKEYGTSDSHGACRHATCQKNRSAMGLIWLVISAQPRGTSLPVFVPRDAQLLRDPQLSHCGRTACRMPDCYS